MKLDKRLHVLVDTREQRQWTFPPDAFATSRGTLATGDYSLAGLEDRVCVERKSLGDFVQTVIRDWLRFRKELVRMSGFDHAIIVVEANVEQVMAKQYESDASPASVMGKAAAIYFDHGVPVYFWGPRTVCEPLVWQWFQLAAKKVGMP